MELDFDTCYRAAQSRDTRFDGRFFIGVTSTGIYCRPICPAQTPKPQNVRFYPSASAAEAAGFRACRRCRPDVSPQSPDWNVRADLVGRALRLIAEGAMDNGGVAALAGRLAVSSRHLHRELVAHVGVGPLALARTRRSQTARLLIDQTSMPLSEIAFTAGFHSIRQFNETMHAAFGCNPSELRRHREPLPAGTGRVVLRLHHRSPFDHATLLTFLTRHAVPGIEEADESRYRRTMALGDSVATVELEPLVGQGHVLMRLRLDDPRNLTLAVQRCRQLFDLDVDPAAVAEVLSRDPVLEPLIAQYPGIRLFGSMDGWEAAARTIVGQVVSVAAARTMVQRLVMRAGQPLPEPDGALTHLFPSAEALAETDLAGLGLSQQKESALRALASGVARGEIALDRGADREETEARLLALPGVGRWTASSIAMTALGDPDAFPVGDLALRRACERLGLPSEGRSLSKRAEAWRPWRGYAVMLLWKSLYP